MDIDKSRDFIYKNARPLDFGRWKFHFEDGNKEEVLSALAAYQNPDGGFGHGLEPDYLNPNSSPMQTWVATRIIHELDLQDNKRPIIQGILSYLGSGLDFNGHTWLNTIPSNNDYPHAPWWTFDPAQPTSYNPTASLAGFILKYAEYGSELHSKGISIATEAFEYFKTHHPLEEMHTAAVFVELFEYLKFSTIADVFNLVEFEDLLHTQIQHVLTHDISKWATEYVCKPSLFIKSKQSDFYLPNLYTAYYECEFINKTQEADGTWAVTWAWVDYQEYWHISKNWWKSDLIIRNLRYLKTICG